MTGKNTKSFKIFENIIEKFSNKVKLFYIILVLQSLKAKLKYERGTELCTSM